ncbi:MAG: phosphatase [Limisphaerales bacterium]|nr:MAG: phosphatase [Limisphaerales bacterium]TXT50075.1 MAG: phosphatase [Limisphaerales bacterium]
MTVTAATPIEICPGFDPRPGITHVVFDFDGTLSLLRHGWPDIMLGMFLEILPRRTAEDEAALHAELHHEVLAYNGRQTIHQMVRFAERVTERGGQLREPQFYLAEYTLRLERAIRARSQRIREGAGPDSFVVPGARALLERLHGRGLKLYILSGTLEPYVRQEAALLELARFFDDRIHGGHEDPTRFSKQMVFDRILREEGIPGAQLLSFGDGPVELHHTKELGGLAVAVASDETEIGSGRVHELKRAQLIAAGADLVIPDYECHEQLVPLLLGASV